MHRLLFSLLCTVTFFGQMQAQCFFDSGTMWFYQGKPYDDTKFEGRYWGDPLEYWYHTTTDYTFIPKVDASGENFFYYATLDGSGEFTATDSIVGVHSAPAGSYKLDRSAARLAVIDSIRLLVTPNNSAAIDSTRSRLSAAASLDEPAVFQIGLLIVQFSNTDYDESWEGNGRIESWPSEPFSVVADQFNTLGHQFEHPNIERNDPVWGVDNEEICGSFRDYWWESSHYAIETNATIINPWTRDNDPDNDTWLELGNTCEYYWNDQYSLCRDAMLEATTLGWIDTGDDDYFDQILVLSLPPYLNSHGAICNVSPQGLAFVSGVGYSYGGHTYHFPATSLSLVVDHFWGAGGQPNDLDWMHIGLAAHEYGHLMGFVFNTGSAGGNNEGGFFCLMGTGNNVGAQYTGECPPRLRGPELMGFGIMEYLEEVGRGAVIDITSDMTDVTIPAPSNSYDTLYRRALSTGDTFLIEAVNLAHENETWDSYITQQGNETRTPPDLDVNLLVWRYDESHVGGRPAAMKSRFVEMGDESGSSWNYYPEWQGQTKDILPGTQSKTSFGPFPCYAYNEDPVPASLVGQGTPATENSEFAILNVRGGDYPATSATANFRVNWPWEVTGNDTLYTPFDLRQDITVYDGATLTILPAPYYTANQVITCSQDMGIFVDTGGELIIKGTSSDPITFLCEGTDTWNGIYVGGGGLTMDYVNLQNFENYGVYTDAPTDVLIEHCHFDGSDLNSMAPALLLWNAPAVTQTVRYTTIEDIPSGVGFYPYNSHIDFEYDTIRNCDIINSYIKKVSGHIHGCLFEGRTSTYAVYFNSATCNPNITCCTFRNLAPHSGTLQTTLYSANQCSPTFAGDYGAQIYPEKSNVIQDTSAYLFSFYGSTIRPTIRINDWYQYSETGKFMQWTGYSTPAFFVERQYWNVTPTTAMFSPSNATYWDWDPYEASPWELCSSDDGGSGGGSITMPGDLANRRSQLDDGPTPEELLSNAMELEGNNEFDDARDAYQALVFSGMASEIRWRAMMGSITSDVHCATGATWIETYLDSLEVVEGSDYQAHVVRTRLLYNYYLNQERYEDAIDECNTLLSSGLTFSDSIEVAIDLLGIQMAAGLVEYHGGLDSYVGSSVPATLQVTSTAQGISREFELLAALNGSSEGDAPSNLVSIPKEFVLYQNYPNPFNPTTQIEFDLPETSSLTLKVFNTLGQEVATVSDGKFNAGHYVMTWNGKSNAGIDVATGLYIYQLKTGSFLDTKKMILMR